jgi:hypothetical protein
LRKFYRLLLDLCNQRRYCGNLVLQTVKCEIPCRLCRGWLAVGGGEERIGKGLGSGRNVIAVGLLHQSLISGQCRDFHRVALRQIRIA